MKEWGVPAVRRSWSTSDSILDVWSPKLCAPIWYALKAVTEYLPPLIVLRS